LEEFVLNKKLFVLIVLCLSMLFSAVVPWPAILTVINKSDVNVTYVLSFQGEQKYFLTATPLGNTDTYNVSRFEIVRRVYDAKVTTCGVTSTWGELNMVRNLRNTFVECDRLRQFWSPAFWGEPGMEKPNFYLTGEHVFSSAYFQFNYEYLP
jgi:hypothetical protein